MKLPQRILRVYAFTQNTKLRRKIEQPDAGMHMDNPESIISSPPLACHAQRVNRHRASNRLSFRTRQVFV